MTGTRYQNGFTLQELMIAIAITIIVTALGIPSYTSYVRNGSRDNTVTDLFSDMNYARSMALKLNNNVSMCPSTNTTSASPTCAGGQDWTSGWLVFADYNNQPKTFGTGDKLLKVGTPIKGGIHVKSNGNADDYIAYRSDGSLSSAITAPANFVVCDNRDGSYDPQYGRTITISAMGRPEIETQPPTSCSP